MDVERENAKAELSKGFSRRASIQSTICSKHWGNVSEHLFLFAFLKSEITEEMKIVFEKVEDLLGATQCGI